MMNLRNYFSHFRIEIFHIKDCLLQQHLRLVLTIEVIRYFTSRKIRLIFIYYRNQHDTHLHHTQKHTRHQFFIVTEIDLSSKFEKGYQQTTYWRQCNFLLTSPYLLSMSGIQEHIHAMNNVFFRYFFLLHTFFRFPLHIHNPFIYTTSRHIFPYPQRCINVCQ